MRDAAGHAVSGGTPRGLDLFERGLHELRCFAGDPVATADAAIAAAPELVMAHALRAWLHLLATEAPAAAVARESLAAAEALPHDAREAQHLKAIGELCAGRWHAAGLTLEDLSLDHPLDTLALQAGHQIDFFVGDARMLRDRIARALPAWSPSVPGWHAVLGMHAFGLEETGDYAHAERLGREAVELEPADGWAQHAVVHVMEMQGRRDDGVRWMRGNPGWQRGSFLGVHNWWHLALHHLAQGDAKAALEIYDGPVGGTGSLLALELLDASALLWRLELRGVDVGDRWRPLAARWEKAVGRGGHYAFNDLHAAMAYARAGRDDLVRGILDAQAGAIAGSGDNAAFTRDVGRAATEAVVAFAAGDHRRAVERLRPIRSRAHRFGGSHAQRDLLDQTLIAAAQASGQTALARAFDAERAAEQARRSAPTDRPDRPGQTPTRSISA